MDYSIYEEQSFVGCDAVLMVEKLLTFCVFVFRVKQSKTGVLDPEDKDATIPPNVGNCSPSNTASHSRRLEFSETLLQTSDLILPSELL